MQERDAHAATAGSHVVFTAKCDALDKVDRRHELFSEALQNSAMQMQIDATKISSRHESLSFLSDIEASRY